MGTSDDGAEASNDGTILLKGGRSCVEGQKLFQMGHSIVARWLEKILTEEVQRYFGEVCLQEVEFWEAEVMQEIVCDELKCGNNTNRVSSIC